MRDVIDSVQSRFQGRKIAVVGDLVADQFLHGTIARVSREAPVFILSHDTTDTRAGGAANAAVNIASLGGIPMVIGVVGNDANGDLLMKTLADFGVYNSNIVRDNNRQTTTKVRVLAGQHYAARQQVIRIDYEDPSEVADDLRQTLIENLKRASVEADAVVLSDYNYGVVDSSIFEAAKAIANERGIPLIVDSRFRLHEFSGATTATPNLDEVEQILGKGFTERQCSDLREKLGLEALLVTRGNKGMHLFEHGQEVTNFGPVGASEPVDVTGAGDTVIAVYALGLASGLGFKDAATIANHAGGLVVMKKGTACLAPDELVTSLEESTPSELSGSSNA